MEKKTLMIAGGGLAAVGIVALFLMRRNAAATQANAAQAQAEADDQAGANSYYGAVGLAPMSYGGGISAPSEPANSGSTNTGGGFDISALLGGLVGGMVKNQNESIKSNEHTAQSSILAGISLPNGGSATVTKTDNSTSVSVVKPKFTDPYEAAINSVYTSVLGRDADAAGLEWWKKQVTSGAVSLEKMKENIVNSDEAKNPVKK